MKKVLRNPFRARARPRAPPFACAYVQPFARSFMCLSVARAQAPGLQAGIVSETLDGISHVGLAPLRGASPGMMEKRMENSRAQYPMIAITVRVSILLIPTAIYVLRLPLFQPGVTTCK